MSFAFVPTDAVARVRARIDHPVIDADGHLLEFLPLVNDLVREVAGDDVADRYQRFMRRGPRPRRRRVHARPGVLGPARGAHPRPHDRHAAEAHVPARGARSGLDFLLLYPSFGLTVLAVPGRRGAPGGRARALNTYYAEVYAGLPRSPRAGRGHPHLHARGGGRRARPRGRDARAEGGGDERRGPAHDASRRHRAASWVDTLGHGSIHDYDPLWAAVRGARGGTRLPRRRLRLGQPGVADELRRTTTWATSPPPRRRRAAPW